MPTLNLGQVRPVYRGAWNSIDTYSAYDFVIYNGSAYLALKDVPANYEPPSQTEYWVLFGAKGEPGTPGKDGVDGAQGERGPSPAYRWDGTFLSIQNPDGTWPDQGIDLQGPAVPLSNSVTSTSETDAASSKAVNIVYDAVNIVYDLANSKQENLGFTPVQQGGGSGQNNSKIYIGHGTNGLKAQIGTTDLGYIVTTAAGTTKAANSASADRAQVANTSETLFVTGWGNTKWGSTPYGQSPLYVWCLPSAGSDMMPCSPSVLSAGAANWCTYTPNVAVGDNSAVPQGGTWKYFSWGYDTATNGVVAGGTNISNRFIAIRVS